MLHDLVDMIVLPECLHLQMWQRHHAPQDPTWPTGSAPGQLLP